jgi:hypothetical protein
LTLEQVVQWFEKQAKIKLEGGWHLGLALVIYTRTVKRLIY